MKNRNALFGLILLVGFNALSLRTLNAETWFCKYKFDNQTKKFDMSRKGNQFNFQEFGFFQILAENKNRIHLYKNFPDLNNYYAISIDKNKKIFSMIALSPDDDSDIISGPCRVKK